MSEIDDGGPAFPQLCTAWNDATHAYDLSMSLDGMSLRDYFAAHAPAEPQSWFKPVMPAAPIKPDFPKTGSEMERAYVREFDSVMGAEEVTCPELRAYVTAVQAYETVAAEWKREAAKQRYIQWPYAWADAMLKARSA